MLKKLFCCERHYVPLGNQRNGAVGGYEGMCRGR